MSRHWLIVTLLLAILLLATHLYALSGSLYWYYPWFDIPVHILGGATVGALLIGLRITKLFPYLLIMLVVVVGWEVFEYVGNISTGQANYWSDTIGDMLNGLIGSLISYGIARYSPFVWR